MATLKVKRLGITIERIPVLKVKQALEIVKNEFPDDNAHTFIYSTVNEKTRIENTITIRK